MQMRVFAIPMDGDEDATEELNRFLRGQKVLSVEKVAVIDKGRHYWSVCVEYLPRRIGEANPATRSGGTAMDSNRPRIDYREILSKDEFARFAKLRDLRRQLAEAEGVPVYTIVTDAQIAEMARAVPQTKTELGKVDGFGVAKLARYGDALLGVLLGFGVTSSTQESAGSETPFEVPVAGVVPEPEPAVAGA